MNSALRTPHSVTRMITFLQGKLVEALPTQVVVDVNGVGYEVLIPLSSFDKLPQPGQPVNCSRNSSSARTLMCFTAS